MIKGFTIKGSEMYKAGEYVVKPNTGICRIEEIVEMDLTGDGKKSYYLLHPIDDKKSTLYVTVDADRKRLRLAMNKEEARDFIGGIAYIEEVWIANEKMREQRYKEALRSNEAAELVAIIKNMYMRGQERLAAGKKITATDDKYFRQAEDILYAELAFSLQINKDDVRGLITKTIEG